MRLVRYIVLLTAGIALLVGGVFLIKRFARPTEGLAAIVNGRPIPQYLLSELISSAQFNESLTTPGRRQALIRLALAGLIEEELALAAAEKADLVSPEEEVAAWVNYLSSVSEKGAWVALGQADRERLKEVMRRRLSIKNFVEWLAMQEVPSTEDWLEFTAGWMARPRPASYLVRVIMLPDLETAEDIWKQKDQTLDTLAAGLKKDGRPVLLTPLFWLPETSMNPELLAQVEKIGFPTSRVDFLPRARSEPLPQAEHQAIYEFVKFAESPPALEELGLAVLVFEAAWREKVYQKWLAGEKARADIQINSSLDIAVNSLWPEEPRSPD